MQPLLPFKKQTVRVFSLISINSVLLYLLAYISLFLVTRLTTAVVASTFNISTVIYYYDIDFLIKSKDWSSDAVSAVFSAPPLIVLILSLILFVIYREIVSFSGISGIFIAWLFIHCLGYLAGEIIMGSILNRGFGYVLMYGFIMDTGKLALTMISGLIILLIGRAISRLMLLSANVYLNDLKGKVILKFTISQFILPFIISTVILQICELPNFSLYLFTSRCILLLLLLPLVSRSLTINDLYFDEEPRLPVFSASLAFITVLVLVAYRIVFGIGLRII